MSRFGNLEFSSGHEPLSANDSSRGVLHGQAVQNEQLYLAQAQAGFEEGKFEEALRAYAKALEFNAKAPAAWIGQVRCLIELGEFDEARVWAEKALNTFSDEPELLAAKAVALARLGDLQGALSFSDAAVESKFCTSYIWLARGDVLLARKEKRAQYCFDKALAMAEKDWLVLWLISRVEAYYRHFARGLKLALEALRTEPARAALWLQAGQCQLRLGLVSQAQNSFEQARELDPSGSAQQSINEVADTNFVDRIVGRLRQWFEK